jgi:hypothetical protein
MKLKPGLFQLIITLMTISLIASCSATPQANQPNCDTVKATQPNLKTAVQQPDPKINDCPPSSNSDSDSGSGSHHYRNSGIRFNNSSRTNINSSKIGRSGFGSFGRGSHGGG